MKKIKCIFCEKERERAKEHVWPSWLQKELKLNDKKFEGTHFNMAGIPLSKRIQFGGSLKFGYVCKKCNKGWMSNLETSFQDIFNKIDNNLEINGNVSRIISLWSFKTVLIINAFSNYRKLFLKEDYQSCYKKKIPKKTKIYIAKNKESKQMGHLAWQQNENLMFIPEIKNKTIDFYKNVFIFYLIIDKIVIKIIHNTPNKYRLEDGGYTQIYPYKKKIKFNKLNTVNWSDNALSVFLKIKNK